MNAAPAQELAPQSAPAPTPTRRRAAQVSETGAIIQMIERAAMNPAVDIEKMERLFEMRERVVARDAKVAYFAAMAQLQIELPAIAERGGIKNNSGAVQSTYAKWEDINEVIKPILSRHGFALSFRTGQDQGAIIVTGVLSHAAGHSEETVMRLPVDTSGSKNSVQAIGSSTSYGKRYTAQALLNLVSYGEDDDGRAGGGDGLPAAVSAATSAINTCTNVDELREWKAKNAATLQALPSDQADAIVRTFNTRLRAVRTGDGQ